MRLRRPRVPLLATLVTVTVAGLPACAALRDAVQPPLFEMAEGRTSQIRLLGPSVGRPLGGAELRIWARIENPNALGFTLTRMAGNILLDDEPAAEIDLPLGLPLLAGQDTVIPLDIAISFSDIPNLADQVLNAITGEEIHYALRGIVAVDAGPLGQPEFGPSTWLSGDVRVVR